MSGTRYTFRANRDRGRHAWLRLTPAYSVGLVAELVGDLTSEDHVVDPFCGTGTTALACAERNIRCDSFDINPFLVWLASAKTAAYDEGDIAAARTFVDCIAEHIGDQFAVFRPPISNIERWWDPGTIAELGFIRSALFSAGLAGPARDLVNVAFCRVVIETSNANFRHQSISLKNDISPKKSLILQNPRSMIHNSLVENLEKVVQGLSGANLAPSSRIRLGDARTIGNSVSDAKYTRVITSPPYPNRMSYIRELRPYMYWLGYLHTAAEAGELDWSAIGGTWGRATSKLARWAPERDIPVVTEVIGSTVAAIAERSRVLAAYVHKYVHDAALHVDSLTRVLAPGARLTYVVGNSRFYDVMVDTERIYAAIFAAAGLSSIEIETLRKRTSKRELYEFAVHARVPDEANATVTP